MSIVPLTLYLMKYRAGKCIGINLIDSTTLDVCDTHRKLFENLLENNIHLITKLKKNMKNKLVDFSEKLLLRRRAIIESVNDFLKNICQIEHSKHRFVDNFFVNLLSALVAYSFIPKKPALNISKSHIYYIVFFRCFY